MLTGLALAANLGGCVSVKKKTGDGGTTMRQQTRQESIDIAAIHIENFHEVSHGLYRGAQPDRAGFEALQAAGFKSVVSLRALHSDRSRLDGLNLRYVRVPMEAHDVDYEEVLAAMQALTREDSRPAFVHCMQGSDRTGVIVAVWRCLIDGWEKGRAVEEMKHGPYSYNDFKSCEKFMRGLDVEKLRADLNLSK